MEVEWDASSSMGVVAEEVGVGGCTGQQLQAQGKTERTKHWLKISRPGRVMKLKMRTKTSKVRTCKWGE